MFFSNFKSNNYFLNAIQQNVRQLEHDELHQSLSKFPKLVDQEVREWIRDKSLEEALNRGYVDSITDSDLASFSYADKQNSDVGTKLGPKYVIQVLLFHGASIDAKVNNYRSLVEMSEHKFGLDNDVTKILKQAEKNLYFNRSWAESVKSTTHFVAKKLCP